MSVRRKTRKRITLLAVFLLSFLSAAFLFIYTSQQTYQNAGSQQPTVDPFPIGVNPETAAIIEQAGVQEFYSTNLAAADSANSSWFNRLANKLQTNNAFQQLASPVSRVFVIWPGERTEEAAENIGGVMRWSATERNKFVSLMNENQYNFEQGFLLPGQYISHRYASPEEIADLLNQEFESEVLDRYTEEIYTLVPLEDALIIASLIEREASDFENMREISGVIWNRLFIDMPLQLDASLQYVKAENPFEPNWWPAVRPQDKFVDSPFNTYQNNGLPPAPIANPSVASVVAALNPRETECIYYFHSRSREYFCSVTYEEHVRKLREVYGQGS